MLSALPSTIAQLAIEIPLVLALNAVMLRLYNSGKGKSVPKPLNQPPYSPRRIMKTRVLLSRLVPPELADLILDHAEFWMSVRTYFARNADYEPALSVELSPESGKYGCRCVVLTEPIQEWVPMSISRLRRIVFEMTSQEQGWSEDPVLDSDPYAGSHTWFEAMIVRDFYPTDDNPRTPRALMIAAIEGPPLVDEGPDPYPDWHVQFNRSDNPNLKNHIVTWSLGETEADDEASLKMTGQGKGAGFLESLEPDDRIALVARVGNPSHQNVIRLAAVELFYAP